MYLGLRDDKRAESVVREKPAAPKLARAQARAPARAERGATRVAAREAPGGGAPRALRNADRAAEAKAPRRAKLKINERVSTGRSTQRKKVDATAAMAGMQPVIDQLRALEDTRKDGTIALPDGGTRSASPIWRSSSGRS